MDARSPFLSRAVDSLRVGQARISRLPAPSPISPSETQRLPIHERPLPVNPQAASPLYNGRIPPEIRNVLFGCILTEYTKTEAASAYPQSRCRPGYTAARTMNIAFMLTCRRVYLETYHLPATLKEHVFWQAAKTGPYGHYFHDIHDIEHERRYFTRFQLWQLALVKEIHLFTQMYWLEEDFYKFCRSSFVSGVERLRITLRAGDWWYNERNHPFYILPYKAGGGVQAMRSEIAKEERGEVIPWDNSGWGCAFQSMQALKELEMQFETTMDRRDEMKTIADRARTWRIPMGERGILSTQGLWVESGQWQGEQTIDIYCTFTVRWKLRGA